MRPAPGPVELHAVPAHAPRPCSARAPPLPASPPCHPLPAARAPSSQLAPGAAGSRPQSCSASSRVAGGWWRAAAVRAPRVSLAVGCPGLAGRMGARRCGPRHGGPDGGRGAGERRRATGGGAVERRRSLGLHPEGRPRARRAAGHHQGEAAARRGLRSRRVLQPCCCGSHLRGPALQAGGGVWFRRRWASSGSCSGSPSLPPPGKGLPGSPITSATPVIRTCGAALKCWEGDSEEPGAG